MAAGAVPRDWLDVVNADKQANEADIHLMITIARLCRETLKAYEESKKP